MIAAFAARRRTPHRRQRGALAATPDDPSAPGQAWVHEGTITGFDHVWPDVHEHYPALEHYTTIDDVGPVHFALGAPVERMELYGRERGWVSVWEVANGRPVEQRAIFLEADDFAATGERLALISGKGGAKHTTYEPGDRHLLPALYDHLRVEVQRDRLQGPYAKNRLAVVATDDDVQVMLDHALYHLRLRG